MPTSFFLRIIEPLKENFDFKIEFSVKSLQNLGPLSEFFSDTFAQQKCDESLK